MAKYKLEIMILTVMALLIGGLGWAWAGEVPPTPNTIQDLIWYICCLAVSVAAILIWRLMVRLEKKVDEIFTWIQGFIKNCGDCKLDLNNRFVAKTDFEEWKAGRDGPGGLWEVINYHTHDPKDMRVKR